MQYKAAIFDLDGTLIDSLADLADSANEMLAGFGFPRHDLDKYRYFVGNGSRKLIERCLPAEKAADSAFVDEALAKYKLCYDRNLTHKTVCYEGIMDMLTALQAKHIPLGICTNKHQSAADIIVDTLFPKDMFVSVIGDCKDMPRKPDPQKVLLIAAKMGVKPAEVAYFGDTSVDMDTANNAGMLPIGVTWGFRPQEELVEHGAKILLDTPMELFSKVEF
ncbi:MAG: HAD family hydrolase [Selenomonas sp.]|nr:HAD family hydrolase [Selenomonas sp.]